MTDKELDKELKNVKNTTQLKSLIKNAGDISKYGWHLITMNKHFTMDIAKISPENIDWEWVCTFNKLEESEIEKYKDYVIWYEISAFQKLSANFVRKFKDKLSLDVVIRNTRINEKERAECYEIYKKNNNPKHHKIWDENLQKAKIFCPKRFVSKYNDYPGARMDPEEPLMRFSIDSKTKKIEIEKNEVEVNDKTNKNSKEEIKQQEIKSSSEKKSKNEPKGNISSKIEKSSKRKTEIDYSKLTKAELKKILDSRNAKYLYHDTIEILRKKCKETE